MRPEVGRRAFVGGVVAASAGALVLRSPHGDPVLAQVHSHTGQQLDAMVRLFIQASATIRAEIRADRLRGEHARRHAAALRMLGTYWRQARVDELVKTQTRQLVEDRGREWVLQTSVDHQAIIDELTRQGVVDPIELPDPNRLTREQRLAGLEGILANGITPVLLRAATFVEQRGTILDQFGDTAAPVVQIALRQEEQEEEEEISCEKAWDLQIYSVQAMAVIVCMMPPLWEICLALQADVLLMQALKLYLCW
jgi:hypothetical protein